MRNHLTIAALATAPAPAGVAVIRVSGPETKQLISKIFRAAESPIAQPRKMIFGKVIDPSSQQTLDHAMAVYFQKPASFTGEDILELHLHGSPILAQQILRMLLQSGASMAEPGEFTRRAFENGKVDLLQAEAVGDLIAASSEQALAIANQQLSGKFSTVVEDLGEPLKDVLAEIEAYLDFPDEDIQPDRLEVILGRVNSIRDKLTKILATFDYGMVVKEGYRVLLCGLPNAGKSSLLNALLGRQRAIVTEVSGTTRDLLEESCMISGYQFVFCDSAGIAKTSDQVEKIGIELALDKISWANLILLVVDAKQGLAPSQEIIKILKERNAKFWVIFNKTDLNNNPELFGAEHYQQISSVTLEGLPKLQQDLVSELQSSSINYSEANLIITNERQKQAFQKAYDSLHIFQDLFQQKQPLELLSAELRESINSLAEIVGGVDTEDILGRIFGKFCIGK